MALDVERHGAPKHDDVQYATSSPRDPASELVFDTFDEAAAKAVENAVSHGTAYLDTLVYSREGAKWLGGDDAVEQYDIDPDASVFERIEIKANVAGMVP